LFRQRTQELLYEAHLEPRNKTVKEKLAAFQDELRRLEYHTLIALLMEDLQVTLDTYGTETGEMYARARQCSQGRQHVYAATAPRKDMDMDCAPMLQRQTNYSDFLEPNLTNPNPISIHLERSPYATESVVRMMRRVSGSADETVERKCDSPLARDATAAMDTLSRSVTARTLRFDNEEDEEDCVDI